MQITFETATPADATAIAVLRAAAATDLTARFGRGHWSSTGSERGVLAEMRHARVVIARWRGSIIATLRLATKRPWAIDVKYFAPCTRPLYLTSMAVHPDLRRSGIGRLCVEEVRRVAKAWPSDAVRLDAYDAPAGAGGFYGKCGFREVGRVTYKGTPLIYYEMLI